MNTEKSNHQMAIFKRVIEDDNFVDTRSLFDRFVDQKEFRKKFFSSDSPYYLNNPSYRLRNEQLHGNAELITGLKLDCYHYLNKEKASEAKGVLDTYDNYQPCSFIKLNTIGEDFLIETRMFNVGYSDESKTPVAVLGFGFTYLCDSITGRKLFLGSVRIEKKPADELPTVNLFLVYELYSAMTSTIEIRKGATMLVGKDFINLKETLLKHSKRYRLVANGFKVDKPNGYKSLHSEIINGIKSVSPCLIDIIQLSDWKKVAY